jgi:hypothetical protein
MDRRHFLKHVAGYSALALPGMEFIRTINANAQQLRRNNKSVVVLWMAGGPATIDIWDLKPGRPTGGEFRPIQTSAQGVQISEHMPVTARQMDKLVILRSLTTTEGDHMRGSQLMHSSYTPNPAIAFPSIGAVAANKIPQMSTYNQISLPNYITVGNSPANGPGFLGMNYAPFTVQNPGTPPENIRPPDGLGRDELEKMERTRRRQRLFYSLEDEFMYGRVPHVGAGLTGEEKDKERAKFADASKAHSDIYKKGFSLVASREGQVFDLRRETDAVKDAYGRNNFGQSALLARKMIEAGVSAVEISLGGWDTHGQNFNALSTRQLPTLDKAMGTLVKELHERGRWQDTVLVWMGEFGRTPRINNNNGRDHWSRCWSIVIGGGAMRGGQAYGTTDQDGLAVATNPVKIGDVFATVYRALGLYGANDPVPQVRDAIGRPFAIAGGQGRAIEALF